VRTAETVVVVGSGIIGASIAYQLARRDVGVLVLEKANGPAEGSTGASAAFIRCRYTHPEVIRIASDSQEIFRDWASFTGLGEPRASLHEMGVLWMLGETRERVHAERDKLLAQGVTASVLSPEEVTERFPALATCDVRLDLTGKSEHACRNGEAFLFEDRGGFTDPVGATQDLVEAAQRRGVKFLFGSRVVAVRFGGDSVIGVTLADGTMIDADLVINAAGPWCNELNRLAGVDLRWSLTPTRIQMVYRSWPSDIGRIPVIIDMATMNGFRLEASQQQVLSVSGRPDDEQEVVADPDSFNTSADAAFKDINLAALDHRVPHLEASGMPTGIAGLYTINRGDHHPVLGPSGVEGFWVANGFSGHGLKLGPAIGSMVAKAVTGTSLPSDTAVPMDYFSIDRAPLSLGVKNVFA